MALPEIDKALITASYFGFRPIMSPKITRRDIELTRDFNGYPHYNATERMALMRTYFEQHLNALPHPLAIAYKRASQSKNKSQSYILHFIGTASGIAEATLIRAALSMLSEAGCKNLKLDINCVGDKESLNAYERELTNYLRKCHNTLSEEVRHELKSDIFNLFRMKNPDISSIREAAPSIITFLSTLSRNHFKEVLEYMETMGVEFRLRPELIGEKNHVSHTIFAIRDAENEDNVLAVGYRYSRLCRLLGMRKEVPMAGVTIFPSNSLGLMRVYKDLPRPKFYLVQLGEEARVKTLSLIELLRTHHIPVYYFPDKDKLTIQLSNAESLRTPYLIIVGQKEALENTATVRNASTRAQDTISVLDLPHFLKHLSF